MIISIGLLVNLFPFVPSGNFSIIGYLLLITFFLEYISTIIIKFLINDIFFIILSVINLLVFLNLQNYPNL